MILKSEKATAWLFTPPVAYSLWNFIDRSGGVHNSYDYSRDKEPLNGYKRGAQDLRYRLVVGVHLKYSQVREYPRSSLNAMTNVDKKCLSLYSPRVLTSRRDLDRSNRIHLGVLARSRR